MRSLSKYIILLLVVLILLFSYLIYRLNQSYENFDGQIANENAIKYKYATPCWSGCTPRDSEIRCCDGNEPQDEGDLSECSPGYSCGNIVPATWEYIPLVKKCVDFHDINNKGQYKTEEQCMTNALTLYKPTIIELTAINLFPLSYPKPLNNSDNINNNDNDNIDNLAKNIIKNIKNILDTNTTPITIKLMYYLNPFQFNDPNWSVPMTFNTMVNYLKATIYNKDNNNLAERAIGFFIDYKDIFINTVDKSVLDLSKDKIFRFIYGISTNVRKKFPINYLDDLLKMDRYNTSSDNYTLNNLYRW